MAKLPAFQFYPADWRKDIGVQSLGLEDRAIWFEMLCVMHESEDRGRLIINGKSMSDEQVSRLIGIDKKRYLKARENILAMGVATLDEQGVLINRRMVKDERLINVRRLAGAKGGNPNLVNQNNKQTTNQTDKQNLTPSSSSSISSSSSSSTSVNTNTICALEKKINSFFNLNELQHYQQMVEVGQFVHHLKRTGKDTAFEPEFDAYCSYKTASGDKVHTLRKFLGTPEKMYIDGGWCADNWQEALKKFNSQKNGHNQGYTAKTAITTGATRKNF